MHSSSLLRGAFALAFVSIAACTGNSTSNSDAAITDSMQADRATDMGNVTDTPPTSDVTSDTIGVDASDVLDSTVIVDATDGSATDATDSSIVDTALPTDVAFPDTIVAPEAAVDVIADTAESSCDNACDHLASCGFLTCEQAGITCPSSTYPPCVTDCIAATPCSSLPTVAIIDCQNMCGDAGGPGSPDASVPDSSSTVATCEACSEQQCMGPAFTCFADTDCQAWIFCLEGCTDQTCATQCDSAHAGSVALYEAVYACQCTSCPSDCALLAPCAR